MKSTIVNTHNTAFGYRPEIDGLRGIAVLSVFIFHLNRNWLPGGFVGVDIFFVLSGYLITQLSHRPKRCKSLILH
jgi:peptidoglycan/LPS O-acetylase OafA/YrhL